IDDEEHIVKIIQRFFERQGNYALASASDGITAMIEVGRLKPDLLILDIMIPGVDGIDVCRRIKADSTNRTAIIAVSGSPDNEKKILQAGADAFMLKPVDLNRLQAESK